MDNRMERVADIARKIYKRMHGYDSNIQRIDAIYEAIDEYETETGDIYEPDWDEVQEIMASIPDRVPTWLTNYRLVP